MNLSFGDGKIEIKTSEDKTSLLVWKRPGKTDRLVTIGDGDIIYEEDGRIVYLSNQNGIKMQDEKPIKISKGRLRIIKQENVEVEGKIGQRYFFRDDAWLDIIQDGNRQQVLFNNLDISIDEETNIYTVLLRSR